MTGTLSFKWRSAQKFHGFYVVYSWKKMHVLFMVTSLGGMQLNISKLVIGWRLRSRDGSRGSEKQNNNIPLSLSLFDKLRARHDRFVKIIIAFRRCSDRFKQAGQNISREFYVDKVFGFGLFSDYLFKRTPHSNCFICETVQVFST